MGIAIIDGFDYYQTGSNASLIWDVLLGNWSTGAGRFGGQYLGQPGSNGNSGPIRTLPNTTTSFVHSFAFNKAGNDNKIITAYRDGTTAQVELRLTSAGVMTFTRNATVLATGTKVLTNATWYWVEVKCTVNNSTGSFEVKINGASEISGSGVNTRNTANSSVSQLGLYTSSGSPGFIFDDMIFQDDQGGTPTFLGEQKITTLLPNAAGTTTNFTPSTGSSNWANVDDVPPNSDTDYNSSQTLNDIDLYNFASFGVTGTILGVQVSAFARKDNTTNPEYTLLVRQSGTNYTVGSAVPPPSTYAWNSALLLTDPATSAAWTTSGIDSAEFGLKVTAV